MIRSLFLELYSCPFRRLSLRLCSSGSSSQESPRKTLSCHFVNRLEDWRLLPLDLSIWSWANFFEFRRTRVIIGWSTDSRRDAHDLVMLFFLTTQSSFKWMSPHGSRLLLDSHIYKTRRVVHRRPEPSVAFYRPPCDRTPAIRLG
ncbi:hypothetical protein M413DRAFT_262379 [Hebeloma cylindrosporum]|uniref:Uncharacterized protein n=1 Tax=Hebeloma cylindrosporum TaxID=76867 RepID=A0A0C3CRS1_HEBCY|nr:hypothetical protein M413DRAFT_262379 [Hebeloma cylindrosporum h7]